eukprot:CAMPEP_0119496522 /NCGR_PEP_ID=MMETSP1344-20130328/19837_1 /TAXON_ID=236787 /ORGANISM="Florenciella parvula, Strain CCMP2471" /LENGTH=137 /DNA_ID=CAMNT_0007532227 /DNA_START=14 /DNA_END=428 /DNA_ORIENTATION=-
MPALVCCYRRQGGAAAGGSFAALMRRPVWPSGADSQPIGTIDSCSDAIAQALALEFPGPQSPPDGSCCPSRPILALSILVLLSVTIPGLARDTGATGENSSSPPAASSTTSTDGDDWTPRFRPKVMLNGLALCLPRN